jgi:protein-disulfide isomerase
VTTPLSVTLGRLAQPVTDDDHVRGPATAPVTLVEYGDYQCPYCGAAYPQVEALLRERGDVVRFAYRHFPLTNVHPYAEIAAEAAEVAAAHELFWPMHDWLFTHQDQLDPDNLIGAAAALGIAARKVALALARHEYRDRVLRDFTGGIRSGVNGTPTFFVNGVRHDGGYTLVELVDAVDRAADRVSPTGR